MTAETMMLSPMPCKSLFSSPTSPYTPSEVDVQELSIARPFWYDVNDEATQDLLNVLTSETPTKTFPDWMPAFEARSSSAASTCATSPPLRDGFPYPGSPDRTCTTSPPLCGSISYPLSPERSWVAPPDFEDEFESPAHAECSILGQCPHEHTPQCPPAALDKSSWLQARKVFVGGIPQSIDQNGLYQMFSKIGKVKKAWLQLFHNDRVASQTPTTKKHRGFGFVIFYEKEAIDQLLDNESSRFVSFGNDMKLEVKRAFGKMSGADDAPSTGNSKKPQANSILASPAPQTCQSSPWMPSSSSPASPWMPASVSPTSQTCQSGSWVASQTWQGLPPGQIVKYPCVPPFPSAASRIVQQPLGNSNTQTLVASSMETSASEAAAAQHSQCPFLPRVFLQGLVGQKSIDSQEFTRALLEAMPDHYED